MLNIDDKINDIQETIEYQHNKQLGKYDRKLDNFISFSAAAIFTFAIFFSIIHPIGIFFEWWNFNPLFFVGSIIIWTIIIGLDTANKSKKDIILMQLNKQNLLILELKKDTDEQIKRLQNDLEKLLKKQIV